MKFTLPLSRDTDCSFPTDMEIEEGTENVFFKLEGRMVAVKKEEFLIVAQIFIDKNN